MSPISLGLGLKSTLRKFIGENRYRNIKHSVGYFYYTRFCKDSGYTRDFYKQIEAANAIYYSLLAETLMAEFKPEILVDVGCGDGGISMAFAKEGCRKIHAFDYSHEAVEMALTKGLPSVRQIDLTKTQAIPAKGDLCICLEVAEHIPQTYARHLCQLLSEVAPNLVLTAAPPGQGGHLHVNEQPQSYWIELMKSFSMKYDEESVARIRKAYNGRMLQDYDRNLMVFKKVPSLSL